MKLAKKILAVLLAVVLVGAVFAGCSSNGSKDNSKDNSASDSAKKSDLTVGFIFLHDENSRTSSQQLKRLAKKRELKSSRRQTFLRVRSATMQQQSLLTRVQTSYLQTASVTKTICFKQLKSSRMFSSCTQQVQRLTQKSFQTTTMHSHQSMRADTLQVLQQV